MSWSDRFVATVEAPESHAERLAQPGDTLTTIEAVRALSTGSVIQIPGGQYVQLTITPHAVFMEYFGRRDMEELTPEFDLPAKLIKRA